MAVEMKSGFVILRYACKLVDDGRSQRPPNFVDFVPPGDMALNYLFDACPVGDKTFGQWHKDNGHARGIYYNSLSDILTDGWEPMNVGEKWYEGYDRVFNFKRSVSYVPHRYMTREEIEREARRL